MGTFILRRLLLMVLTLFGITLLVFFLVDSSPNRPGGAQRDAVGASVGQSGLGILEEAYFDDRFGLSDPAVVRYLRWLGKISPVKLGRREVILANGEVFQWPRQVRRLPGRLLAERIVGKVNTADETPTGGPIGGSAETAQQYDTLARRYAQTRAEYVRARVGLCVRLGQYAREAGWPVEVDVRGLPDESELDRCSEPGQGEAWEAIARLYAEAETARRTAERACAELVSFMEGSSFARAGVPLVPDVVGLGWPDLGRSAVSLRPVAGELWAALPVTLLLNLVAFAIMYSVAVPCGVLAASNAGRWPDTAISTLAVALWSVPTICVGVLCVGFLCSKQGLGWFPSTGLHDNAAASFRFLPSISDGGFQRGFLLDAAWHLALPVLCLAYGGFALISQQTRAAVLESLRTDYVRTANAKGVRPFDVVVRHAFANSLLPLITMFAAVFPAMLSGSVVVERVFGIPGMGSLMIEAISARDTEVLMATTLLAGVLNVAGLLLADVLYCVVDPRITHR